MNKKQERFYLDKFKFLCNQFPNGEIIENERPDFLVVTDTEIIGIEVTELHRNRSGDIDREQISQVSSEQVVRGAQADYTALGLPFVYVTVHFNSSHLLQKKDVMRLRDLLLTIVKRNIPKIDEEAMEEADWSGLTNFPDEIYQVKVRRLPSQADNFFNSPVTTWVSNFSDELLAQAVNAKEGKISVYRQQCEKLWMLIVSDTTQISTWFNSDTLSPMRAISSGFDRIFLLRNFLGRVSEVKVSRPNIDDSLS